MSAIDASCFPISKDKESGAGEMNPFKSTDCEESSTSQVIVSEIVNEIFDNAFDQIVAKTSEASKVEKISPNVVGDILENILSASTKCVIPTEKRQDETVLLDEEIKRIIKEMKCPPEPKKICTKGVGDQLGDKIELAPDKVLTEPPKRNTLERKNRLTNLVRNSKQMLAKFVSNESLDNANELKRCKSEEMHEKLLKVIDLDSAGDGQEFSGAGSSKTAPGLIQMPSECMMEMIDLEQNAKENCKKDLNNETEDSCSPSPRKDKLAASPRRKMSFGAKILRYIRKRSKKE